MNTLRSKSIKPLVFLSFLFFYGCSATPAFLSDSILNRLSLTTKTVSVTGSATGLKRLTTGGPTEYVTDISPDSQWLLVAMATKEKKRKTWDLRKSQERWAIAKLNLRSGIKVVLTPQGGNSQGGKWLHHKTTLTGLVLTSDLLEPFAPLIVAAYYGKVDLIAILLNGGADPAIQNFQGKNPLSYAKEFGFSKAVKLLSNS